MAPATFGDEKDDARRIYGLPSFVRRRKARRMQRKRVPIAIWVTLWATIAIAALALIITVVARFAIS